MNNPDNDASSLSESQPASWIGDQFDIPEQEIDAQFSYNPQELPLPSTALRGTVSGPELDRFLYIGSAWATLCSHYYPQTPTIRILDIGCGVGKMARFFALLPQIDYIGFDIFKPAIDWCQFHFERLYGNRLQFFHFDGHSSMYNPSGKILTQDYSFPCEPSTVDVAVGASILTHLYEEDIRHYLEQTAICLRKGGKAIFSTHTPDEFEQFFPGRDADYSQKIIGNEQVMMIDSDYLASMAATFDLILVDRPGRLCGQEISVFEKR